MVFFLSTTYSKGFWCVVVHAVIYTFGIPEVSTNMVFMRKPTLTLAPIFLLTLLTCLFLLSPNVVLSETVKYEDLVTRKGLYYQKSSDVPFTGNVTGKKQGEIKKGKREGPWVRYYKNGQLSSKGTYKNGKQEGPWVLYHKNGKAWIKVTYKDAKQDGPYVEYDKNGQVKSKATYKDGVKVE